MSVQQIAANKVLETTETQGTVAYVLEGPSADHNAFRDRFANGATVTYCCQMLTTNGSGEVTGLDYEIVKGVLTYGGNDELSRATILDSSNGGAAVDWGAGTKTVFSCLPAELVPLLDAPLTAGQNGKALIVNSGSTGFTLGGPYLPTAGGAMTGALSIITAGNQAVFRHTTNDGISRNIYTVQRGSGAGGSMTFAGTGGGADDLVDISWSFTGGVGPMVFRKAGTLGLGADGAASGDAVRKGQVDAALALKAPLASPALTGTPTAPTAAGGTNTTQIATTAFATGQDFGVGQTPQDVTGSRAADTNYQNTTGKPIFVHVLTGATTSRPLQTSPNGSSGWVSWGQSAAGGIVLNQYAAVPNGYYYRVSGAVTITEWSEVR